MITPLAPKRLLLGVALASLVATASTAEARYAVTAQASVRVWLEGGDVYDDYSDVVVWLKPEHDCYATLFMVDTDGFVHVLYPSSLGHDPWLYGGRAYCYRACDLGLDRFDGAGIAYVFAVGSPVPFDYSYYGARVFVGGFGFRVYGDPFVACRDFYLTLLPASCRWDYVGVSYARFYVRRWERYPSYLCYAGPGVHVFAGGGCRACADVYVSYRTSCARPWDAFRPAPRFKSVYAEVERADAAGRVARVESERYRSAPHDVAGRSSGERRTAKELVKRSERLREGDVVTRTTAQQAKARVVSTSAARERAAADQADVVAMGKKSAQPRRAVGKTNEKTKEAAREVAGQTRATESASRGKGTSKKVKQAR